MGWFGRLFNRGQTAPANPAAHLYGLWPAVPDALALSPDTALSLAPCWSAVHLISQAVACSDFRVFALDADGARTAVRDPGTDLLNWTPNPEQSASEVKAWIVRDMLVHGVAYAELVRTGGGRVVEIWPLYSERVYAWRDPDTWALTYRYTDDQGHLFELRPDQVLVARYARSGESVLRRAMRSLALAKAEQDFAMQHFAGGVSPASVITVPAKLTPKQRQELAASLSAGHAGPGKNSGALLLDGGATITELSLANASAAQLLESRRFSVQEVGRAFGIHPALLADEQSAQGYGVNQVAFLQHSYRAGLLPVAVALSEALTRSLYRPRSAYFCEIDLEWYLSGGRATQAAADSQDIASRVISVNEARAARGLAAAPWGDPAAAAPAAEGGAVVQDTALNGAQVTSLLAIVTAVAAGELPPDTARAMIQAAFPAVDSSTIDAMLSGLEGFGPAAPEAPAPAPAGAPPAPAATAEAEGKPTPDPDPKARAAALDLAAQALGRHATRCAARRADLRRAGKGDDEIAAHLEDLGQRGASELTAVLALAGLPSSGVRAALSAVTAGVEPSKAAAHLLGG